MSITLSRRSRKAAHPTGDVAPPVPRGRLSYANVTASLALFLALGGTSYAAIKLPAKTRVPQLVGGSSHRKVPVSRHFGIPNRCSACI